MDGEEVCYGEVADDGYVGEDEDVAEGCAVAGGGVAGVGLVVGLEVGGEYGLALRCRLDVSRGGGEGRAAELRAEVREDPRGEEPWWHFGGGCGGW